MEKNQIIELSTGTSTIVVVKDLPKDEIIKIEIVGNYLAVALEKGPMFIGLPAGQYSILGWSDEISGEQAKGLVKVSEVADAYFDYVNKFFRFGIALESFRSFLTANNIERELLLIKI